MRTETLSTRLIADLQAICKDLAGSDKNTHSVKLKHAVEVLGNMHEVYSLAVAYVDAKPLSG